MAGRPAGYGECIRTWPICTIVITGIVCVLTSYKMIASRNTSGAFALLLSVDFKFVSSRKTESANFCRLHDPRFNFLLTLVTDLQFIVIDVS